MSSSQGMEVNNPKNPPAGASLSLEELNVIVSVLFLVGSGLSLYIAYKNLSNLNSTEPIE